jgi:predicted nuclease of predicted toxin-antitoxin system
MYLVIDECCGKKLKPVAEDQGHAAQRSVEIAQLGRGATDSDIFSFAAATGAVVATINHADFLALAKRTDARPGLIFLPALRGTELARVFKVALPKLTAMFDEAPTGIVQVDSQGGCVHLD